MSVDNELVQNDPTKKEIKFILELFNSHKLIEAKKVIDKQLVQYPKSSILHNILGAVLTDKNKFEDSGWSAHTCKQN